LRIRATDEIERALEVAVAHGAKVQVPAMAIDDLGSQAIIVDPAGAVTGIWQPAGFPGFTVVPEPGTPSFIAIDVDDYYQEVAFYRQVFGWAPLEEEVGGHHYAGYMDPGNNRPIAGIGDEVESLPAGETPSWSVFWQSDDVDASVAKVSALGGAVVTEAADQGLGRVARVADPSGARFWLFRPPAGGR
jgi:predicted enzyme related to lactoylglutathione lyase